MLLRDPKPGGGGANCNLGSKPCAKRKSSAAMKKNVLTTNQGRERTVNNLINSKNSFVDPDPLYLWASRIRILPSTTKNSKKNLILCDFF